MVQGMQHVFVLVLKQQEKAILPDRQAQQESLSFENWRKQMLWTM